MLWYCSRLQAEQPELTSCVPAADANILINTCRLAAQQYQLTYQEKIPVEQLVRRLCDNKQVLPAVRKPVCGLSAAVADRCCVSGLHTVWRAAAIWGVPALRWLVRPGLTA